MTAYFEGQHGPRAFVVVVVVGMRWCFLVIFLVGYIIPSDRLVLGVVSHGIGVEKGPLDSHEIPWEKKK